MQREQLKEMIADILQVWDYRSAEDSCNSVYMGGMATAHAIKLLGGEYGRNGHVALLEQASENQIAACHKYLTDIIRFMKKHPVHKCPTCGQIVQGPA